MVATLADKLKRKVPWWAWMRSAWFAVVLYGVLAASESSPDRRTLFEKLSVEAEAQAAIWQAELERSGGGTPPPRSLM